MSNEVLWNTILVDEFIELGGLTEFEETVIRQHAKGRSRTQIAMENDVSLATVDRCIRRLKKKYDSVQPYSLLLPTRK